MSLSELTVAVKGRLRERYDYWCDVLHAPESILCIVREGYFLPLMGEPPSYVTGLIIVQCMHVQKSIDTESIIP